MAKPTTNHLFRIGLPPGWTDGTVHFFQGPNDGGERPVLSLSIDETTETNDLQEFARERVENALASFPQAELVQEDTVNTENGSDVQVAVIRYGEPGAGSMFKKMYFLMPGRSGYTFIATLNKRQMKTVALQVDEMVKRFNPSGQ